MAHKENKREWVSTTTKLDIDYDSIEFTGYKRGVHECIEKACEVLLGLLNKPRSVDVNGNVTAYTVVGEITAQVLVKEFREMMEEGL